MESRVTSCCGDLRSVTAYDRPLFISIQTARVLRELVRALRVRIQVAAREPVAPTLSQLVRLLILASMFAYP
eukprot:14071874-Heterocapsa_arctica.AAC.1